MSSENQNSDLIGQRKIRIEKVNELKAKGINPYPGKSNRTHKANQITENYDNLENEEVTIAGRLMSWREHGHLVFGEVQDQSGSIQLYISQDKVEPTNVEIGNLGFEDFRFFDIGDIVEAKGVVTKTQRGEISVAPSQIRLLTKAIRPLPNKKDGLKDKETIFRKRYLDTILNPNARKSFEYSAKIVFAIREFLNKRGFLEIKTPIIQPIYGGTNAKPFVTRVNTLNVDYYLAVAHELYLKKLVTGGFENVYNINGYFRNEGIDRTHNPEFRMLETMTAFENYEFNMNLTEELYKHIADSVFGKREFKIFGNNVSFDGRWERLKMIDAVIKYAGIDFNEVKTIERAHEILDEIGFNGEKAKSIGECMVQVFEEKVEEQLIQPVFIYGHPVEISPLAKQMPEDSRFVERFELFIGGVEAGDNWTELNDPIELYNRFREQVERGRGGDDEFHPMDVSFIEAMEYGMPPTTGLGPGIERLVMMFTENEYIDDVLYFPMMKPAPVTTIQKEIYGEEYLVDPMLNETTTTEQDFENKIVIVVNKDLENWQITNTVAHISAYLGNKLKDKFATGENFVTEDGKNHPRNSQYAIVTLAAKPGQMQNFMEKVRSTSESEAKDKIIYHGFIREMIDSTDDLEIVKILEAKKDSDIEYLGIGVFGQNDILKKLTNKFSLFK